jgi:hypothetical protein
MTTISHPNRKFDVAVSSKWAMRTSYGISGFGNNNWEFTAANNNATANADCHHSPFIILMTGRANAAHNKARTA